MTEFLNWLMVQNTRRDGDSRTEIDVYRVKFTRFCELHYESQI